MYLERVLINTKLMRVRIYEHALYDTLDNSSNLYSCLLDDRITDFSVPKIFSVSCNKLGFKVDFKYRYQNGIKACIEDYDQGDILRRENNQ